MKKCWPNFQLTSSRRCCCGTYFPTASQQSSGSSSVWSHLAGAAATAAGAPLARQSQIAGTTSKLMTVKWRLLLPAFQSAVVVGACSRSRIDPPSLLVCLSPPCTARLRNADWSLSIVRAPLISRASSPSSASFPSPPPSSSIFSDLPFDLINSPR